MTTNEDGTITADSEAPAHGEDDQSWQASDAAQYHAAQEALETALPPEQVPEPVQVQVPVPGVRALKKETSQLRHALEARPVIGLARGIIMTLGDCTQEEAFQVLMDVSRHTNIELREIAQRLVDSVDGPPPSRPLRTALHDALARLRTHTA